MKMLNCNEDCTVTIEENEVIFDSYIMDDFGCCIDSQVVFDLYKLKSFLDKVAEVTPDLKYH